VNRVLLFAIRALAFLSAATALVFVAYAFVKSPQNPVAAEIGYEALRVARKLPLYVDPWKGAWEDGAPPARFYVLYTPMFPWLVGKLASPTLESVRVVGRTIAVLAWLTVHIVPVLAATKERRRDTAIAAMLAAGIFFIARNAASMSSDTLAAALVCLGISRAARHDRIDPISAVLLVAAPFVKPSCLGGVAGAALAHLALRRPGWIRATIAAAAAAIVLVGSCWIASDGAWLANMARATGQPINITRWVQEFGSRSFVLGVPHAVVAWLAWRRRASWFTTLPLAGAVAWSTFMMAKHGSGSHYWVEPTTLALITIGRLPVADEEPGWIRCGAFALAVTIVVSSFPGYLSEPARYRKQAAVTEAVDRHCVRQPGEFVVASDLVLELALNGRITVPSWQSGFLARTGKFPLAEWREDLARPEVRWVALAFDPRAPLPNHENDTLVEVSPFYDVLKDVLLDHYAFDDVVEGVYVFRRK
jgi:hypothetical protein